METQEQSLESNSGRELDQKILNLTKALSAISMNDLERAQKLGDLARQYHVRFLDTGEITDLNNSIDTLFKSTELLKSLPLDQYGYIQVWSELSSQCSLLGSVLNDRFQHGSNLDDWELAVKAWSEASGRSLGAGNLDLFIDATDKWGAAALKKKDWSAAAKVYEYGAIAPEAFAKAGLSYKKRRLLNRQTQDFAIQSAYAFTKNHQLEEAVTVIDSNIAISLCKKLESYSDNLRRLLEIGRIDLYARYRKITTSISNYEARDFLNDEFTKEEEKAFSRLGIDRTNIEKEISELLEFEDFNQQLSFSTIKAVLTEKGAGVYILEPGEKCLALIVDKNGVREIWLDFSLYDFANVIDLQEGQQGSGRYLYGILSGDGLAKSVKEILPIIGERIVRPIAHALQSMNVKTVTLIPIKGMALLPYHASTYILDGQEKCLLDQISVSYAPSARFLYLCPKPKPKTTEHLLGIGNPLPYDNTFSALPFSEIEVEWIKSMFPGSSKVLYREKATAKALESEMQLATHIHIACHGDFNFSAPLFSGFYLSNHSKYFAAQLFAQQEALKAQFAVLSACQTAIPDFESGTNEITGLITAFLWAGVPKVLGTLWPIDDLSTALLMMRFYQYYINRDSVDDKETMLPVDALRKAQLWIRDATTREIRDYIKSVMPSLEASLADAIYIRLALEDEGKCPFAHPVFWAGFAFHGS